MEKDEIYKIKTKPIVFEIIVSSLSRAIPNEIEKDFLEWLEAQAIDNGVGFFHEYYSDDENYKNDIGVSFEVKLKYINYE